MKKVVLKCPRCGHEKNITSKTFISRPECDHCHYKWQLDPKTEKRFKIWGYVISFTLMFIVCGIATFFVDPNTSSGLLLVFVLIIALVVTPFSEWLSTPFVINVLGFDYIPLEDRKKK